VDALLAWVQANWDLRAGGRSDVVLTTGDPRGMRAAAQKAFGVALPRVSRVRLPRRA
jgi:hypothetical protein